MRAAGRPDASHVVDSQHLDARRRRPRVGAPPPTHADPRQRVLILRMGGANHEDFVESLVDSELVSGVNSLIYREDAGRSREYGDPATARCPNAGSIPGPRR